MSKVKFIIIVGFPRSGTTMLREALANHACVAGLPGEASFLLDLLSESNKGDENLDMLRSKHKSLSLLDKRVRNRILDLLLTKDSNSVDVRLDQLRQIVVEQYGGCKVLMKYGPLLSRLRLLGGLETGIRIIHMVRDPRAVLNSNINRWPEANRFFKAIEIRRELASCIEWDDNNNIPMMTVRYEDLVLDSEAEMRKICNFTEIDFSMSVLKFSYVTKLYTNESKYQSNKIIRYGFEVDRIDSWKSNYNTVSFWLYTLIMNRIIIRYNYKLCG